ncbi:MAG: hypothetical protein PHE55_19000 [Methylococcaceae bacterium]|nr:hypothetical protein [Methylococcaceae bacterium]
MTANNSNLGRNRLTIALIALICIVPFGLAWVLAKNPHLVKDRQKTNYGHLITSPRSFDYADFLKTPITAAENLPEIKGRWVMVQVAAGADCQKVCKDTVVKTGQLRLLLNKEIPRVRRLLLFPDQAGEAAVKELAELDPTLLMAGLSDSLRQSLQEAVGTPLAEGMVLLFDPFGNLMMWYEPGFDPFGLLRDLQRLLKVSQIG